MEELDPPRQDAPPVKVSTASGETYTLQQINERLKHAHGLTLVLTIDLRDGALLAAFLRNVLDVQRVS